MDLKSRLANSASLQKKTKAPIAERMVSEEVEPVIMKKERIPDPVDKMAELEKKLMQLEAENQNLKKASGQSNTTKWNEFKRLTVGVDREDYEAFKEGIIEKLGPIYQPNRLGNHKTTHNPFFRALFSCFIARIDNLDLDNIGSEEDIYNEVVKLFK